MAVNSSFFFPKNRGVLVGVAFAMCFSSEDLG